MEWSEYQLVFEFSSRLVRILNLETLSFKYGSWNMNLETWIFKRESLNINVETWICDILSKGKSYISSEGIHSNLLTKENMFECQTKCICNCILVCSLHFEFPTTNHLILFNIYIFIDLFLFPCTFFLLIYCYFLAFSFTFTVT